MPYLQTDHTVSNKSMGIVGKSVDSRSQLREGTTYRDYTSLAEVLAYLTTEDQRKGHPSVFVTQNGVTEEYWWKDGTADNNLVQKTGTGGGAAGTASLGITKTGDVFQLGQATDATGDPALINVDRIIPISDTKSLILKGLGVNGALTALKFDDTMAAPIGQTRSRTWLQFEPLEKGQNNGPFTLTQSSTKYGAWKPDEVFMMGWNLTPGGTQRVAGQPGLGISMEQDYRPSNGASGLTELHDFWIKPTGEQVRITSFTINNGSGDIDYYNTLHRIYSKHPGNAAHIWNRTEISSSDSITQNFATTTHSYTWTYDTNGVQLTMSAAMPVIMNTAFQVNLPGAVFTQNDANFYKETSFNDFTLKANGGFFVSGNFAHGVYPNETSFHVGGAATFDSTMRIKGLAGTGTRMVTVSDNGTLAFAAIPSGGGGGGDVYLASDNIFTGKNNFSGAGTTDSLLRVGAFEFQPLNANNALMALNLYWDGTNTRYRDAGYGGSFQFNNGGFNVSYAAVGAAGAVATPIQLMLLDPGAGPKFSGLAGTGTEMIVANDSGVLSRQAIPGGGGGDVTLAGNNTFTGNNVFSNSIIEAIKARSSAVGTRIVVDNTNVSPDSGFRIQQAGVDKWDLVSATGGIFNFYNIALGSSSFTIEPGDNKVRFFGPVRYDAYSGTGKRALVVNADGTLDIVTGRVDAVEVAGTTHTGAANTVVICTNVAQTSVLLPTTAAFGDKFTVVSSAGAIRVTQDGDASTGQRIYADSMATTRGSAGRIDMANPNSAITFICTVGSGESGTEWRILSSQGTITAV